MPLPMIPALWSRAATTMLAVAGTVLVAACSGFGGGAPSGGGGNGSGLAPGLVAEMDQPGAVLDQNAAFAILDQYRAFRGTSPFTRDPGLGAQAQSLAQAYASSGTRPNVPSGMTVRYSAGYTNFADTFSGWRSSPADASALSSGNRAGLAVAHDATSEYGTYWVLLVAP